MGERNVSSKFVIILVLSCREDVYFLFSLRSPKMNVANEVIYLHDELTTSGNSDNILMVLDCLERISRAQWKNHS